MSSGGKIKEKEGLENTSHGVERRFKIRSFGITNCIFIDLGSDYKNIE